MADTPPAPRTGSSPLDRLSREQKIGLGVAAGGGALGLLLLARRGAKTTGSDGADTSDPSLGQSIPQFSDAGIGAYNNLQAELEALQKQLHDVQDQLSPKNPVTPVPLPTVPKWPGPVPPIKKAPVVPPRRSPTPPVKKLPKPPPVRTYTVKAGDSLSKIAAALKISGGWRALYNRNKAVVGPNPNLIHPGQRLTY